MPNLNYGLVGSYLVSVASDQEQRSYVLEQSKMRFFLRRLAALKRMIETRRVRSPGWMERARALKGRLETGVSSIDSTKIVDIAGSLAKITSRECDARALIEIANYGKALKGWCGLREIAREQKEALRGMATPIP
jgi:hypothetical protein